MPSIAATDEPNRPRVPTLAGRTAFVTGAGGDIGRAIAGRLAARGARLVLSDLASATAGLASTADECERAVAAAEPIVIHCDVTERASVEAVFEELARTGAVPDLLVNNAGYQGDFANTADYDVEDFRRVLDVNLVGVFIVLRAFARTLIAADSSGAVVNIASMAQNGAPNMIAYSASKAGVVALTRTAAKDLAPHGIRVNSISPAFIGPGAMWDRQVELQANTPSQYFSDDPAEVADQMIRSVPLRRFGSLDEVAAAVQFLLSDEASYITAFDLEVAGGTV